MTVSFKFGSKFRIAVVIVGLAVIYAGSALLSYRLFTPKEEAWLNPLVRETNLQSGFETGELSGPEENQEEIFNILLIGYGGAGHSGGNLADALMVVSLNETDKKISLISIPRDIWVSLPDGEGKQKINTAFARGGGELAKTAAGKILGMKIDNFAAASFDGFSKIIDELGGVEVEVPVTFDDYYYPVKGLENETCGKTPEEVEQILTTLKGSEVDKQFLCRYEHLHFDKGRQKMNGVAALKFVRSRHAAQHGGDFSRSVRQQALILGLREKLRDLDEVGEYISLFQLLFEHVKTDMDEKIIGKLVGRNQKPDKYPVVKVNLTTENVLTAGIGPNGEYILMPAAGIDSWGEIHNYIKGKTEETES